MKYHDKWNVRFDGNVCLASYQYGLSKSADIMLWQLYALGHVLS